MNINNLKQCKLILEKELSDNLKSNQPVFQTKLAYLIDGLRELINLQEFPEKNKKLDKLIHGN